MFALLTDRAFAWKPHSAVTCGRDEPIFSWCLLEFLLEIQARATRSKAKKPECPPQEESQGPWSNLSVITKNNSKH